MKFLHVRTEGFSDGMFFQQKSRKNKTENQYKPAIESTQRSIAGLLSFLNAK